MLSPQPEPQHFAAIRARTSPRRPTARRRGAARGDEARVEASAATRVTLRPSVAADIAFLTSDPLPARIQGITAQVDGKVIGLGGLSYRPDGTVIAFAAISEEARKYPAAIHRAGLKAMKLILRSRLPMVVAEAEPGNPAAERWLARLGFEKRETSGQDFFVWERSKHVQ